MPELGDDAARLPRALRKQLDAFPVEEVRDTADRLAGVAVEVARVRDLLGGLGVASDDVSDLCNVYVRALYRRLDAAGKNWSEWPPDAEGHIIGVVHDDRGRLLETAGRMMRSGRVWLSNRRVSVRRGRWERLLP